MRQLKLAIILLMTIATWLVVGQLVQSWVSTQEKNLVIAGSVLLTIILLVVPTATALLAAKALFFLTSSQEAPNE